MVVSTFRIVASMVVCSMASMIVATNTQQQDLFMRRVVAQMHLAAVVLSVPVMGVLQVPIVQQPKKLPGYSVHPAKGNAKSVLIGKNKVAAQKFSTKYNKQSYRK